MWNKKTYTFREHGLYRKVHDGLSETTYICTYLHVCGDDNNNIVCVRTKTLRWAGGVNELRGRIDTTKGSPAVARVHALYAIMCTIVARGIQYMVTGKLIQGGQNIAVRKKNRRFRETRAFPSSRIVQYAFSWVLARVRTVTRGAPRRKRSR